VGSYIRFVRNLGLNEQETSQILYRNAARVFHLDIGEPVL
jgi:predicted TIM-barrel fold metal-dependent hydrolase